MTTPTPFPERDALEAFLEAQDALDNHEVSGPNVDDYFTLMRRRNGARKDLDAALASLADDRAARQGVEDSAVETLGVLAKFLSINEAEEKARPGYDGSAPVSRIFLAAIERFAAQPEPIAAEVVPSAVALKRLEKHVRRAGDCPDDSKVVLWSAINRLATPEPEVPADRAALAFVTIDGMAEAFQTEFCPYKGSPDPWIVWRAAWQSALKHSAAAAPVPDAVTVLMSESMERRQQAIGGVRAALREFGHDAEGTVTDLAAKVRAALAAPAPEAPAQADGEDTARLDWLGRDGATLVFKVGNTWYSREGYGLPICRRLGFREAIDAARNATQEGK